MANKKKKKKSNRNNNNNNAASNNNSNSRSNNQRNTAAAVAAGTTSIPKIDADVRGRMPEKQGRQLYKLLTLLAAIGVPRLNQEREQANQKPVDWYWQDMAENPVEIRDLVISHMLRDIDYLVAEVMKKEREPLCRQILGRRLTATDKANFQSWKVHVKDDFIVVDHVPRQGTVMVQIGRYMHRDYLMNERPDFVQHEDVHEPRIFVVQGLADSLSNLTESGRRLFQQQHPSIVKQYPALQNALCMVHTTLLPYNGGITYMTTMCPVSLGSTRHYNTPQDLATAVGKAAEAYQAAFPTTTTTTSTTTAGDATSPPSSPTESSTSPSFQLYRSLDPDRDAAICRLANSVANQNGLPLMYRPTGDNNSSNSNGTRIEVYQMLWHPLQDRNDPRFELLMDRASNGMEEGGGQQQQPFVWEGVKNAFGQEVVVHDGDPCPFHKRFGQACQTFDKCCKSSMRKRIQKAEQKGNVWKRHLMYDPVDRDDMERLKAANHDPNAVINIMPYLRIAFQDVGSVRLRVDPKFSSKIQERVHSCDLFHSVLEYKWIFWGYVPLKIKAMGIMSFGDVTLDPVTGIFEARAMTSKRLGVLIEELKHICTGIPILEASLEMTPSYKTRTDPIAFEKNKALLQKGLSVEIRASVNKEEASMGLHCAFCGVAEDETASGLLRCACKSNFYCCKEHQRQHWVDHKEKCRSLTGTKK